MRIVLFGQASFGAETLQKLLDQKENIVGVITTTDPPNQTHSNPVKQCAERNHIPLLQADKLKTRETIDWVTDLNPDLLVLAFFTSFVPQEMIDCATHGGINYHPSLLPRYRGGSAINWAVINGETETGVSIHFIDSGVDTGPVLLQKKVVIEPEDTVKSVYFNKLYPLGITMMADAVRMIRENKIAPTIQDESKASFQPVITSADTVIDWNKPTSMIYNLIRGSNPVPGAGSFVNTIYCKLFDCCPVDGCGKPGEILAITDDGLTVATADGAIKIKVIQQPGSKKQPAAVFAEANQLTCQTVFTSK